MNIFKALSYGNGRITETNISSVLAYLLNPTEDHGLNYEFVNEFVKSLNFYNEEELLKKYSSSYINYDINVLLEFPVSVKETNSAKSRRSIDILLEFYDKYDKKDNPNPVFSICVENKIIDTSFSDMSQISDEILGLENNYKENKNKPEIYFVLLCPKDSKEKINNSFSDETIKNYKKTHILWKGNKHDKYITKIINNILKKESTGKIDPISTEIKFILKSFLSFINNGFQSKCEQQKQNEKTDYGRPVIEYLRELYDKLEFDKEYTVKYVKDELSKEIKKQSGKTLHSTTRNCQMYKVIVNDINRTNYSVKSYNDPNIDLFYYVDKEKREDIMKYKFNQKEDVDIYWTDENGERTCKKLSELKNKDN